jgi:hypothetical protein
LFAERVAPTGKVIGVDRSPELISYAARHRGEWEHLVEFTLAAFSAAVPFADNAFDAVFFPGTNRLCAATRQKGAHPQERVSSGYRSPPQKPRARMVAPLFRARRFAYVEP